MTNERDYGAELKALAQKHCDKANDVWRAKKNGEALSSDDEKWLKEMELHCPAFFVFATTGKIEK